MITLTLNEVDWRVVDATLPGPDGRPTKGRVLQFIDPPSAITINIPTDLETAGSMGRQMQHGPSGIQIASAGSVPPAPPAA